MRKKFGRSAPAGLRLPACGGGRPTTGTADGGTTAGGSLSTSLTFPRALAPMRDELAGMSPVVRIRITVFEGAKN